MISNPQINAEGSRDNAPKPFCPRIALRNYQKSDAKTRLMMVVHDITLRITEQRRASRPARRGNAQNSRRANRGRKCRGGGKGRD